MRNHKLNSLAPRLSRREFIRVAGVGVTGYSLLPILDPLNVEAKESVKPRGGAEVCILLMLQGGPSQVDTFDLKEGAWTPEDFDVQTVKPGLRMPVGTLPGLSRMTDKYAIARSMGAWDLNHDRSIYYLQAGRTFSPNRVHEVPSIGSVLAYEYQDRRGETDFLPPFISFNINTDILVGCGMLPPSAAPMNIHSGRGAPAFVLSEDERAAFERRQNFLKELENEWHDADHERARIFSDLEDYSASAFMLGNPKSGEIFTITDEDRERYGKSQSGFGHLGFACAMARNIIAADAGTRFIFMQHSSWDLHNNIYDKDYHWNQYTMNMELDLALSKLLDDLETTTDDQGRPLIDKTLVIAMGEFGRSGGALDELKGRNHHIGSGVALFAGAGVKGGQIHGATNETGDEITDFGWHKERPMYPEDVLATIYSAMGVDWTKKITQTPSGRAFEYTEEISPKGPMDFGEISELFA